MEKKNHKFILSCHQPLDKLAEIKRNPRYLPFFKGLERADIIVVLSNSQVNGYRDFAPNADIRYLPLGVDTGYFYPGQSSNRRKTIVTVGSWLRDYACWARVVKAFQQKNIEADFIVVANRATLDEANRHLGAIYPNVKLITGISDDELRSIYQQARVLFLPLQDAVGNNALLEAMACGVAVVISDLPATREYASEQAAILIADRKPNSFQDAIIRLIEDDQHWQDYSYRALHRINEVFAWPKVADGYQQLYRQLGGS